MDYVGRFPLNVGETILWKRANTRLLTRHSAFDLIIFLIIFNDERTRYQRLPKSAIKERAVKKRNQSGGMPQCHKQLEAAHPCACHNPNCLGLPEAHHLHVHRVRADLTPPKGYNPS
jgi:hypothetical protein